MDTTKSPRDTQTRRPPVLDHERLEVYWLALELRQAVLALLPRRGALRDQIDRASASVVLNIAEGAGRMARADKRRFYEIARGSVTETAARLLAARVAQMLSRLTAGPRGS